MRRELFSSPVQNQRGSRRRFLGGAALPGRPADRPRLGPGRQRAVGSQRADHDRHVRRGQPRQQFLAAMEPLPDHQVVAIADCRRERALLAQQQVERVYAQRLGSRGVPGLPDLQRLPRGAGPRRHRRHLGLRARPLARRGLQPRDRGRQGSVRREAGHSLDRRRDQGPRRRPPLWLRLPDRHPAAEFPPVPPRLRIGSQRLPGQGTHDRGRCAGRMSYPVEPPCDPPEGFDYDTWTGPAPYLPFDKKRCEWLAMYMISHYCAGFITNWGVHHLDIAGWGCPEVFEKPFEVEGTGVLPSERHDRHLDLVADGVALGQRAEDELLNIGNPSESGCKFVGDEGWVCADRSGIWAEPASLLDVKLKPQDKPLHASPDHGESVHGPYGRFLPQHPHAAGSRVARRGRPRRQHAGQRVGHRPAAGPQAAWDPAQDRFVGDDEAKPNAVARRPAARGRSEHCRSRVRQNAGVTRRTSRVLANAATGP